MDLLNELHVLGVQAVFNERILETKTCWFCGEEAADKNFAEEISLSKNQQVKIGLTSRHYQWEELRRKIPCCPKCNSSHRRTKTLQKVLSWLGGIVGLVAGLVLPIFITIEFNLEPTKDFNLIMFLSVFGGIPSGALLGYLLGGKIGAVMSDRSKPIKFGHQHPFILELLENGWRTGTPR